MKCFIVLKSKGQIMIENIKIIKSGTVADGLNTETSKFDSFIVADGYHYAFIGNKTVSISGGEILYVEFE